MRTAARTSRRDKTSQSGLKSRRSKRRRLTLVVLSLVMLAAATALANAGPYQDYRGAQARLAAERKQVEALMKENEAARDEMERLEKASYLEMLARKDLAYARPGEEVIIVKGLEAVAASTKTSGGALGGAPEGAPGGAPGPLERLVRAVLRFF